MKMHGENKLDGGIAVPQLQFVLNVEVFQIKFS